MNKKTIFLSSIAAAGILFLGASQANAGFGYFNHDSLIDKLAAKFKLNKTEVQSVFEQVHKEKMAAKQKSFEERLAQAVKDGKLTEAQKKLLLEKMQERQKEREEMRDWFQKNNIDPSVVGGFGGRGMNKWHMK